MQNSDLSKIDLSRLKNREPEVLKLMLDPTITSKEIGYRLGIANVSQTLNRVYMICGIKSK